jgi:RNase P/RNase MRP subunit POP5
MVRTKNRYLLVELVPFCDPGDVPRGKRSLASDASEAVAASCPPRPPPGLPAFTPAALAAALHQSVETNYGRQGAATLGSFLSIKYCNSATLMFILRVPREQATRVWHCLAWLTTWPVSEASPEGLKCTWAVRHLAGTIRSCQKAAIAYARSLILEAKRPRPRDSIGCGRRPSSQDLEGFMKKVRALDP